MKYKKISLAAILSLSLLNIFNCSSINQTNNKYGYISTSVIFPKSEFSLKVIPEKTEVIKISISGDFLPKAISFELDVNKPNKIIQVPSGQKKIEATAFDINNNVLAKLTKIINISENEINKVEMDLQLVENKGVTVESIKLDNKNFFLNIGQNEEVLAKVIMSDGSETKDFRIETENNNIIEISGKKITAIKEGVTQLLIISNKNTEKRFFSQVLVNKISNDKFSLNPSSANLKVNDTLQFNISPSTNQNSDFIWQSTNENVAKIDNNGLLTTISSGSTTIKVNSKLNESIKLISEIKVESDEFVSEKPFVKFIEINKSSIILTKNKKLKIDAKVIMSDGSKNNEIEWKSKNENIIEVNNQGETLTKNIGNTNLELTSKFDSKIKTNIFISVVDIPVIVNSIIIKPNKLELAIDEERELIAIVNRSDNSITNDVSWQNLNPEIISIDKFGKIKALKEGVAQIKATSVESNKISTINTIIVSKEGNKENDSSISSGVILLPNININSKLPVPSPKPSNNLEDKKESPLPSSSPNSESNTKNNSSSNNQIIESKQDIKLDINVNEGKQEGNEEIIIKKSNSEV